MSAFEVAKSPIRRATAADIPHILGFIRELAEYENEPDKVLATEDLLAETLFGSTQYAKVLIAQDDDGTPTGFALYFYNYSTWNGRPGIYLEDLYVQPKYRRKNFGTLLLYALAGELKQIDGKRLEWSVLKWNTPSIEFYKSLGAVPLDEWDTMRIDGDRLTKLAEKAPFIGF
ncbi:acyl-CoA N-acyltransferase [Lipomyces japonicus]|uniref:acyl-CoA N-acyltransferase n=1 Tax=Lipomyces japonicus TaxID=56871 RepID=UPI0034CFF18F